MKMKVLGLSVIALALFAITGRSVAHPVQGAAVQRTVIANYPINPQSPVLTGQTVIANYPINGVSAYPMAAPTMATYAPTHYQAVQVPIQAPLPVPMPAQVPVQVQYLQQQASTQVIPAPVSYAVAQPVPTADGVAPNRSFAAGSGAASLRLHLRDLSNRRQGQRL